MSLMRADHEEMTAPQDYDTDGCESVDAEKLIESGEDETETVISETDSELSGK